MEHAALGLSRNSWRLLVGSWERCRRPSKVAGRWNRDGRKVERRRSEGEKGPTEGKQTGPFRVRRGGLSSRVWYWSGIWGDQPSLLPDALQHLKELGLVYSPKVIETPGVKRRHSLLLISARGARVLADWHGDDQRGYVERSHAVRDHCWHAVHDLEANQFFRASLSSSRPRLCRTKPSAPWPFRVRRGGLSSRVWYWSGRRASNPLPRPWQGRALPSELLPLGQLKMIPEASRSGTATRSTPSRHPRRSPSAAARRSPTGAVGPPPRRTHTRT